jgi:hypothetical protein
MSPLRIIHVGSTLRTTLSSSAKILLCISIVCGLNKFFFASCFMTFSWKTVTFVLDRVDQSSFFQATELKWIWKAVHEADSS